MFNEKTKDPKESPAPADTNKQERRAAMAEIKRRFAGDPAGAREAARLWFEQHGGPAPEDLAETSAFHRRKLEEADPDRQRKAAEALMKNDAEAERAQALSRDAVQKWRKKNPNKVKKLNKQFREKIKAEKSHK